MNINLLIESVARQQRHLYGGSMSNTQQTADERKRHLDGVLELFEGLEKKHEEAVRLLREMTDMAEEGSAYKGEYLAKKHGDAEEIAKARQFLATQETTCPQKP
jgi:hypothetical protein